jgi:hypothetical protein
LTLDVVLVDIMYLHVAFLTCGSGSRPLRAVLSHLSLPNLETPDPPNQNPGLCSTPSGALIVSRQRQVEKRVYALRDVPLFPVADVHRISLLPCFMKHEIGYT